MPQQHRGWLHRPARSARNGHKSHLGWNSISCNALWLRFLLGNYRPQPILREFTILNIFYFGTKEREKGLTCEKLQLCDLNAFWSIWDKAANSNAGWRSPFISPTKAHYTTVTYCRRHLKHRKRKYWKRQNFTYHFITVFPKKTFYYLYVNK